MEKVIILPMDGYKDSQTLLSQLRSLISEESMGELLAYVKINDGVHNPNQGGPAIIGSIKDISKETGIAFKIFLDLKIFDVSATLENVLKKYLDNPPDILTVSANCSLKGILALRRLLPQTKLALVSALTDISETECRTRFGMFPALKIYNDWANIRAGYQKLREESGYRDHPEPFDLIVCSYHELEFLGKNLPDSYGFIVPGIRDQWMKKQNEHQERTIGVSEALMAGATYVVMGAQLTKGNPEMGISAAKSRQLTIEKLKKFSTSTTDPTPIQILTENQGYYRSPKNPDGSWAGPLVAYAGTYESGDGQKKNYVGAEYFNFARLEENYKALEMISILIDDKIEESKTIIDGLVGAPMGGIMLATLLGQFLKSQVIFAEKKITALADPQAGKKEESRLIIDRHNVYPGARYALVEDVCNNFSTTGKMKQLIEEKGGKLVAIICAFNRSGLSSWEGIPIINACFIPTQQWRQEDPEVADLINCGKIVWKPKLEWEKLQQLMD